MMKILFLTLFLVFPVLARFDFTEENDPQKNERQKVDLLLNRAETYLKILPDSTKELLDHSLSISKSMNDTLRMARTYFLLGEEVYLKGDNTKALEYYKLAAALYGKLNSQQYLGIMYNRMGLVTRLFGKFDEALNNLLIAFNYSRMANDSVTIAGTYNEMGLVYRNIGNQKAALNYFTEALNISMRWNIHYENIRALNYLGSFYFYKNDFEAALRYYLEAKQKAELFNSIDDIYAGILNNLGNIYREIGQPGKAIEYYEQSLKISRGYDDKNMLQVTYKNKGILLGMLKRYDESLYNLELAYSITEQTGTLRIQRDILLELSNVYEETGNFKKGLEFHKRYQKLNEEVFNEDMNRRIAVYTLEFENERKKNDLKELELSQQILFRNLSLILFVLSLVVLIVMIRLYIYLKKSNSKIRQQKFELEKLNVEMEGKNVKLEEFEDIINRSNVIIIKRETENYFPVVFVSRNFNNVVGKDLTIHQLDQLIHPEDLSLIKEEIHNNLEKGIFEFEQHFRLLTKKGYNWFVSLSKLVEDMGGRYLQSIIIDVNERKELENQLNKTNDELKKRNIEKDKFFSIVAHDLKSPFLGLLGLSGLLKDEFYKLNDTTKENYIKNLHRQLRNVYIMIENLLDWSRLQMKKFEVSLRPIDLQKFCERIIELISLNAEEKNVTIENRIAAGTIIKTDEKMMQAILSNLISNSVKYSNENGRIRICSEVFNDEITIVVEDNGIGMDNELKNNFLNSENFTSTKGTSGELGTGLGLTIVKEMVEKLNGKIFFESGTNSGTKVYLIFTNSTGL